MSTSWSMGSSASNCRSAFGARGRPQGRYWAFAQNVGGFTRCQGQGLAQGWTSEWRGRDTDHVDHHRADTMKRLYCRSCCTMPTYANGRETCSNRLRVQSKTMDSTKSSAESLCSWKLSKRFTQAVHLLRRGRWTCNSEYVGFI